MLNHVVQVRYVVSWLEAGAILKSWDNTIVSTARWRRSPGLATRSTKKGWSTSRAEGRVAPCLRDDQHKILRVDQAAKIQCTLDITPRLASP
mmetsp:Transcript_16792/g.43004  ORF Transcript_16792/g.43004 Transcript_16792/m.43004 type:complete len:92 (-) Transcript_16792:258-533(-)